MIKSIHLAAVVCLCSSWSASATAGEAPRPANRVEQAATSTAPASIAAPEVAKSLAGAWKAAEDRLERYSQLDVEVFGPHAFDVRNVDLTVQPSGDGVLKVSTKVVDQKGRTYSPAVIEAKLRIGAAEKTAGGSIQPAVTVISAEERYLDGSGDHWSRDGSQVRLTMTDLSGDELNFRFDAPNGRGSFGATLTRQHARSHNR